jgi:hypothetical protein
MKEQQDRIATVLTTNCNPLFDATDGNVAGLVNALCGVNGIILRVPPLDERKYLVKFAICCVVISGCGRARWGDGCWILRWRFERKTGKD